MAGDVTIERLILDDPGSRGVAHLFLAGQLASAAQSLLGARNVVIATGFFIPPAGAPETDGPPGALALGDGLRALGARVTYLAGERSVPVLMEAGLTPITSNMAPFPVEDLTHMIAVECPSRAADGCYYSMKGVDLTSWTDRVDQAFLDVRASGIVTIGIGDGGNEIGMGKVAPATRQHIPHGERIASVVETDFLVVAGTSNWGAWGLLAELSIRARKWLLPSPSEARDQLQCCVKAGAVDGKTHRREATVDGLDPATYLAPLAKLETIVAACGIQP